MKMLNPSSLLKFSLVALALTSLSALADTGHHPVSVEAEIIRAVSSQADAHQQKSLAQPKHRSLLSKEIREPKSTN